MADREQESFWVLRAQAGDRGALEELLRAVQAPLYRCIAGVVDDGQRAEDVLQEVLFRVCRKLAWLRDPALLRPWCYRIATREAYRQLRRSKRRPALALDEAVLEALEAPSGEGQIEPDLLARLPTLLGRISPASRLVLVLHYQNELSLEGVAEVLGVPLGTVKSRLAYGLKAMRRLLGAGRPAPGEVDRCTRNPVSQIFATPAGAPPGARPGRRGGGRRPARVRSGAGLPMTAKGGDHDRR